MRQKHTLWGSQKKYSAQITERMRYSNAYIITTQEK